ncbi:MAG: T9SS type A sorting domain-containing protein [Crocinitomicaceae bacterium]|nr:T9SS type A sorting domain-containing protein [Crocinitomicaceae bacterium]
MKKKILFALALTAFGANAQQKLIGLATREFDETTALVYNDSIGYTYNTWQGSLTSNEPEFKFNEPVFDFLYNLPTIKSNEENVYGGMPLAFDYSRQNTIVNGEITDSEVVQSERQEFTYDASGNLTKIEYYFWNITQFDVFGESNFEYDANNNLLVEAYVSDPISNPNTESVDSSFYDASNNLIRFIAHEWDGVSLVPTSESLMTFTGNEIDNLQLFENSGSQLEWVYDIYYTYTGGMPDHIDAFAVTSGVPSTTTEIEIYYTYNADDQLSLYEGFVGGDLLFQQEYTYDTEGFVTKMENSDYDFATSTLFISEVQDFYYQSTADLNELSTVEAIVYPNPSNDFITIDSDEQIDQVTVLAADGKVMIEQKGNTVDVSNLTTGIYLVNVMTAEGRSQTRFVKN